MWVEHGPTYLTYETYLDVSVKNTTE